MTSTRVIEADLTWLNGAFHERVQIEITDKGRIGAVGVLGRPDAERLSDRAIIPGMVSTHSHAFQRGLRGRGERFPAGAGTFWTWREAMYRLAASLDEDALYRWCLLAFGEMRREGITAVGEFHYLHHTSGNRDFSFDRVMAQAARESGIRLVLMPTWYRTGGIGQPLQGAQLQFATPDMTAFLNHLEVLAAELDPETQHAGVAAHSVRAASPEEIAALYNHARERGWPFHIHLEEQRQEIEACRAAYGMTPMALLLDRLPSLNGLTAVHCTHSAPEELGRFLDAGGRVCLCPLTEAGLGDGIADLPSMLRVPGALSLGTDSNARISMLEEMRLLEFGQRLSRETRGVV
ncbi:MAG: amidohydrolase family protein, partial [Gemmatimonadales bacterium]